MIIRVDVECEIITVLECLLVFSSTELQTCWHNIGVYLHIFLLIFATHNNRTVWHGRRIWCVQVCVLFLHHNIHILVHCPRNQFIHRHRCVLCILSVVSGSAEFLWLARRWTAALLAYWCIASICSTYVWWRCVGCRSHGEGSANVRQLLSIAERVWQRALRVIFVRACFCARSTCLSSRMCACRVTPHAHWYATHYRRVIVF